MEKNDNATEVSNTGTKNGEWKTVYVHVRNKIYL